jgi:hypothetical protein
MRARPRVQTAITTSMMPFLSLLQRSARRQSRMWSCLCPHRHLRDRRSTTSPVALVTAVLGSALGSRGRHSTDARALFSGVLLSVPIISGKVSLEE